MICFVLFLKNFFFVQFGATALHFAAEKGFEEVVKILIKHEASIDLQDEVLIFFFIFFTLFFYHCDC